MTGPTRFLTEYDPAEWMRDAACKGRNGDGKFFPTLGENHKWEAAKAICERCPVRRECLEYALRNVQHFGVWGGTTERERKHIRKRRRVELYLAEGA